MGLHFGRTFCSYFEVVGQTKSGEKYEGDCWLMVREWFANKRKVNVVHNKKYRVKMACQRQAPTQAE